jgi:hypothetical protein
MSAPVDTWDLGGEIPWARTNGIAVVDDSRTDEVEETNASDDTESSPATPTRSLTITPASQIKPRPVRWAWDTAAPGTDPGKQQGRLPVGSLSIAVGRAGIGKSQFAAWLTAQVTNGALPGAFLGRPRSVIYVATEDSWEMTLVPRLMAAGADLSRVFRVGIAINEDTSYRLILPHDNDLLELAINAKDAGIVVMDPLLSLVSETINDYRAREVRAALEPVVQIADRTGAVLLGLAHFTKATGTDPLMLVSGSAAFGQLVRSAIGFARDDEADEPTFVLSTIKNNLGREDLPSLAYRIEPFTIDTEEGPSHVSRLAFTGKESERSVRDLLRAPGGEGETNSSGVDDWLRELLENGPMESNEVYKHADAAGYSKDQMKRAKGRIGAHAVHPEIPGPWFWELQGSAQGVQGGTRARMLPCAPLGTEAPVQSWADEPLSEGD